MQNRQRFAGGLFSLQAHGLRAGVRIGVGLLAAAIGLAGTGSVVATEAAKAPRLAQPQSLSPLPVYLPAQPSATRAVLSQPAYVGPSDEVIVSDLPAAAKTATPVVAKTPDATPRKLPPTPTTATPTKQAPSKWSSFWQLVTGPPATGSATPHQPVKPQPTSSEPTGGLLSQILGTSSPPPDPALNSKPEPHAITNPFLLTSAQTESAKPPANGANPPDAKEKVSAGAHVEQAGLLQQLGVAEGAPASAPQASHVPSQPSESVVSALWRPLVMTNNAPPAMHATPAVAARDQSQLPESERVPSLMRPFYATNPAPHGSDAAEIANAPHSLAEAIGGSRLGHQLAMLSDEDLRTAATVATLPAQLPAWDGTIAVEWPLMANPFLLSETADPGVFESGGVRQVAFFQEEIPVPPGGPTPDDINLPGNGNAANDQDTDDSTDGKDDKKKKEDTLAGAKKLGNAPEDNTLEFLRAQTVLLNPGKMQFDVGLEYTLTENNFPILLTDGMGTIVGVDDIEFQGRELAVPMEIRYGLLKRVQVFLQVPVGWSNTQVTVDDFNAFDNDGGLGDVGFGATVQLQDAVKDCPYLIGTLSAITPTGGDPFTGIGLFSPSAPSLGSGFWSLAGNLLWVQTRYDPVILFYGFGSRFQFAHEYVGINFQPGVEYNYTLGTGFAVNERVTLSAQFFGAYINELKADGTRLVGTNQEPMNLRFAATLAKPCNRIVEPFVMFGLTDDSISTNFGITWTY